MNCVKLNTSFGCLISEHQSGHLIMYSNTVYSCDVIGQCGTSSEPGCIIQCILKCRLKTCMVLKYAIFTNNNKSV